MRIEEALERFIIQLQADGRSPHTIGQYRRHVQLFAAWARDVGPCANQLEEIGHADVAKFLSSTAVTGRAGGGVKKTVTANTLRSSLRNFLRYCHHGGITTVDAGRLIRRARCSPPPPRAISEDDQRRLLEKLAQAQGAEAERDHALFHLLLRAGIRIGSAIALDVEDVFLDTSEIRVRTAKGDRPDVVFLGEAIREHLRRYLAKRSAGPLFTAKGHRVSQRHIQRRLGMWASAAGITQRVTAHSLRHRFAMRIYSRTHDVLIVKEALQHRSIASTMVYTRVDETRLRAAL